LALTSSDVDNRMLHVALGEALTIANGGRISDRAKAEFDVALRADPNDLIARFYMAYCLLQNDKPKPALVKWVGLMRTVGADKIWYDRLWTAMPLAAEKVGVDRLSRGRK
jgi:cytochrome c-type biogenesis protein CcmH/NrfG